MKKSYGKGLATHIDPESCGAAREGGVEAISRGASRSRAVTDPVHVRKHLAWEPGDPAFTPDGICRKFSLELHPEKTRLLEFGPFATENRKKRGEGKPETFNFLGFTHICGQKRGNGRFTVLRQTIRKRLQAKLSEVKAELKRRRHDPIPEVGQWLRSVVGGHIRYYGVPTNRAALYTFRFQVGRLWHRTLLRRSQKARVLWDRMRRLIDRWLPPARTCHPYPLRRMGVIT